VLVPRFGWKDSTVQVVRNGGINRVSVSHYLLSVNWDPPFGGVWCMLDSTVHAPREVEFADDAKIEWGEFLIRLKRDTSRGVRGNAKLREGRKFNP
jgi:hypothetical protein